MLKTVMYIIMIFGTFIRLTAVITYALVDKEAIPLIVLIVAGMSACVGLILIIKNFIVKLTNIEYIFYYGFLSFTVVFNILYIFFESPLDLQYTDLFVTGTFTDIMVNTILIAYAIKSSIFLKSIPKHRQKSTHRIKQ